MNEINEIKIPKGVDRISVKQHDDRVVIKFIPEGNEFKKGDFVYEDGRIMIIDKFSKGSRTYSALIYPNMDLDVVYDKPYAQRTTLSDLNFRHATDEEKQLLIDAMKKDGKRWNAEKKCIEDIPQPKFKEGDKVRIKDGISSKTHRYVKPHFTETMDKFIGKELTVKECRSSGHVFFNEDDYGYQFSEDWLEPWSEEPKNGDLAIFWDDTTDYALIRIYGRGCHEYHYDSYGSRWGNAIKFEYHYDSCGTGWKNAIKFESKEQFEKVLRGEIN